ncbi:LysR substrate binding domain-containing protein [Bosea lupini]|uniref:LysR substrate binding domain-containing protein n=2 Tax=Bosea lupini TaxID=1036779 RepID=A0A1H7WJY5_9HYPH|nr:LysR substrate binding domain-containing protein [Bosea lupini]
MIAGTVRITCSEVIGAEVIPPILAGLKRGHPRLSFELTLTNKIENVLRRDADIAVRMTRPTQDDLVARRIGAVPLGLYAHDSWVRANGVFASIEALIGTGAFIGYDRDPGMVRALAARGISVSQGDFGFRTDSDLAQLSAIRSGVGVGVCQIPIAARTADLQRILPDFSHDLEIWLVTHAGMRHANRVRITFDALASGLTTYLSRAEPPTTKH